MRYIHDFIIYVIWMHSSKIILISNTLYTEKIISQACVGFQCQILTRSNQNQLIVQTKLMTSQRTIYTYLTAMKLTGIT